MNTLYEAAQQALEALELHAKQYPHMVKGYTADAADDLRAALKREEEALAWLEERKKHWRRELDRMRSP